MPAVEDRIPPGLTPERVGFFTDAVFAIAMTLLVIEIPRPEDEVEFTPGDEVTKVDAARNLLHFLYEQTGSFVAYVLAFTMLWIVWRQHHGLIDRVRVMSPRLVGWHFPLLLLIGFVPYPVTTFGHHTHNPVAAAFYALVVGGLLVCRSAVQSVAIKDGLLREGVDVAEYRRTARISWFVTAFMLSSLVLAWWTPWIVVMWSISPLLGGIVDRLTRKRA